MQITQQAVNAPPSAPRGEVSPSLRFVIDRDVVRGRGLDFALKFLPDGLSRVGALDFLTQSERCLLSQIQGRTYANMLAMLEQFIGLKTAELTRGQRPGGQATLGALTRIAEEECKHQELFRRLDRMIGDRMPEGYVFVTDPNVYTRAALGKSTWAALGLICLIEVSVLAHHRANIDGDPKVSPIYRDVLLHHAREESQHAIIDALEWAREDLRLDESRRDCALDHLIGLLGALDGIAHAQATADTEYFLHVAKVANGRAFSTAQVLGICDAMVAAYRWQYLTAGLREPRFSEALAAKLNTAQATRLRAALALIVGTTD